MNFCKTTGCTFAACALAATLGACGGGFDDEDTAWMLGTFPTTAAPSATPSPLDRTQAQALERALDGGVVWIDDACCNDDVGAPDANLALGMTAGVMAARDLGRNAPVFVALRDRREGAALAERFAAAGYTRVILVTD